MQDSVSVSNKNSWLGYSSVEVHECSIEFFIDHFSWRLVKASEQVNSPEFYSVNIPDIKWFVTVGSSSTFHNCHEVPAISVAFNLNSRDKRNVNSKYCISILDVNGKKAYTRRSTSEKSASDSDSYLGCYAFIKTADLQPFLHNDRLTLLCEVSFVDESQATRSSYLTNLPNEISSKNETLSKCLDDQVFSDIIFKFENDEIKAHRVVLAAVSPVFKAMFMNEMAERVSGEVEITDISFETFQEMIKFIYTGNTDKCQKLVKELLYAANKYDITPLKSLCEKILFSTITLENALDILKLSVQHSCPWLKPKTIDFISGDNLVIKVTEVCKFFKISKNNDDLLSDILSILTSNGTTDDVNNKSYKKLKTQV